MGPHSRVIVALIVGLVLPVAAAYECASHWTGKQVLHDIGDPSMKGKTVVINGGDSGIGLGGATALAAAGANIIFLGYNSEKARAAMKNITAVTGSTSMFLIDGFDLSSFANVHETAAKVLAMAQSIDVLILDAGDFSEPSDGKHNITEDGVEITFQINFLGHVLLTQELLPAVRRSKGRVVFTSSVSGSFVQTPGSPAVQTLEVCGMSGLSATCVEDATHVKAVVTQNAPTMPGYGVASLAFYSYYTRQFWIAGLARREAKAQSGVRALAFHPGVVHTALQPPWMNASVFVAMCKAPSAWFQCQCYTNMTTKVFDPYNCPKTLYEGGSNLAFLAAAPDADVDPLVGKLTAACSDIGPVADPFQAMVAAKGEEEAEAYTDSLMRLWDAMIAPKERKERKRRKGSKLS